jgi:hypothetical protein
MTAKISYNLVLTHFRGYELLSIIIFLFILALLPCTRRKKQAKVRLVGMFLGPPGAKTPQNCPRS